jgi:hypothetical protein
MTGRRGGWKQEVRFPCRPWSRDSCGGTRPSPGGWVRNGASWWSCYFANHLHVEVDTEAVRQRMFNELERTGEIVVGYPDETAVKLEMEIISGPSELTGFLTLGLVDADGLLRRHPH